jgi:hypothetical protein
MSKCKPEILGATPANIKWNVVRGDTSRLLVEFLENDEKTFADISSWDFSATAYNPSTNLSDELDVEVSTGYVEIIAQGFVTEQWGTDFGGTVASLKFDLQVTLDNGDIWTPIIGTVNVLGDVTGAF